jgi:uncharacterized protein (TIGR03435 family)
MCKYVSINFAIVMCVFVLPMSALNAQAENQKKPSPEVMKANVVTGDPEKFRFEVVSIRRNPDERRSAFKFLPGGRLKALMTLRGLIAQAYEVPILQIMDGPNLLEKPSWDIEAKPEEGKYPLKNELLDPHIGNLMIQSMLEDRFKLKLHQETMTLNGYELVIAKGGHKLKNHPLGKDGKPDKGGGIMNWDGEIGVFNASPSILANVLNRTLHCHVVDKTGLQGLYDMKFTWTPDKRGVSRGASPQPVSSDSEITIFDAIQEQLGLKLVPAQIPTQVLVVDNVQMPTIN